MDKSEKIYRTNMIRHFKEEWFSLFEEFICSTDFKTIVSTVRKEKETKGVVPNDEERALMFKAFREVSPPLVRCVILGSSPYSQKGRFDGLAYSNGRNLVQDISKELSIILDEVSRSYPKNNSKGIALTEYLPEDLRRWTEQGVLLINKAFTVIEGEDNSHIQLWEPFTKYWITRFSETHPNVCWLLIGEDVQSVTPFIKRGHIINTKSLTDKATVYPFSGSNCFVEVNSYLTDIGKGKILW